MQSCRGVEALLLGLYNLEAVDENCQSQNVSFRLPSLAQSSIYHEVYGDTLIKVWFYSVLNTLNGLLNILNLSSAEKYLKY